MKNSLSCCLCIAAFSFFMAVLMPSPARAGDVVVAPDGAGGADDIIDGTVDVNDIGTGAVGSDEVVDDSLTASDIGTGAVGSDEVTDDSLTAADIGTGAVGSDEVTDDSLTAADIAAGAVGTSEITDGSIGMADLSAAVSSQLSASTAQFDAVNGRIDDVEAGVAMAMAMSSTGHVSGKTFSFSLGSGVYKGEAAASTRFSYAPRQNIILSVAAATAAGDFGGSAGVTFGW
jgi:hypothetical protein